MCTPLQIPVPGCVVQGCPAGELTPKSLGLSFSAAWVPRGTPEGARAGRGRAKAGLSSPALPSPALLGLLLPEQLPAGAVCLGMALAEAPWDLQGLQTVGIILLLCSSLKILHALGIIDLTRGGGMGTGMGMGLQGDGDVVV